MDKAELEVRFTYHPPTPAQVEVYNNLRFRAKMFAEVINQFTPDSREKSLAITNLEQAVMWANAALARRSDGAAVPSAEEQEANLSHNLLALEE